jgi:hypothetical protein
MQALRFSLAIVIGGNGLWMLIAPLAWFTTVPGVAASGAFNAHFVRDVGAAYALCGLALFLLARGFAPARPYARAGVAFLLVHAALHLIETVTGVRNVEHLVSDLPGVVLLPLAAVWAVRR